MWWWWWCRRRRSRSSCCYCYYHRLVCFLNCSVMCCQHIVNTLCNIEELKVAIVTLTLLCCRVSLMGQEDAVALNVAAQKISAILTKLRPAEDKVLKAFSTWTEEETNDPQDVPSYSNLVNCHTSVVFEKNGCILADKQTNGAEYITLPKAAEVLIGQVWMYGVGYSDKQTGIFPRSWLLRQ